MAVNLKTIGSRVRARRLQNDITQEELAAAVGVAPSTMYRIEHGLHETQTSTLQAIANYLQVTEAWLLRGDEAPAPPSAAANDTMRVQTVPLELAVLLASCKLGHVSREEVLYLSDEYHRGAKDADALELRLLVERTRTAPPEQQAAAHKALMDVLSVRSEERAERPAGLIKHGSAPPPPPKRSMPRARHRRT